MSSSNYYLCNSNNIHLVNARISLYYNSFLPSADRDWNNIPDDHRNEDSTSPLWSQKLKVAFHKFLLIGLFQCFGRPFLDQLNTIKNF